MLSPMFLAVLLTGVVSRQRQAPYAESSLLLQPLLLDGTALQGSVGYGEVTGALASMQA